MSPHLSDDGDVPVVKLGPGGDYTRETTERDLIETESLWYDWPLLLLIYIGCVFVGILIGWFIR